jgi:hypothetical protein
MAMPRPSTAIAGPAEPAMIFAPWGQNIRHNIVFVRVYAFFHAQHYPLCCGRIFLLTIEIIWLLRYWDEKPTMMR